MQPIILHLTAPDQYLSGFLLFQQHGAVQEAAALTPLPELFRGQSFLLKKQKERTHVDKIPQNTSDVCPRSSTQPVTSLKEKGSYVPGVTRPLQFNQ